MRTWIENWLIMGLLVDWFGLMLQKHGGPKHQQPPYHWTFDVVCIVIWPFSVAAGIISGFIERSKRK